MMNDEYTTPEEVIGEEEARNKFETFLYHQRRAVEETGRALEALLPEGFRTHSKRATEEFTTGLRVLVDAALEEIKKAKENDEAATVEEEKPSTTGKTKVKVQVE